MQIYLKERCNFIIVIFIYSKKFKGKFTVSVYLRIIFSNWEKYIKYEDFAPYLLKIE